MNNKTIVFEWADYEEAVRKKLGIKWEADFVAQRFDTKLAKGYETVCIFVESKLDANAIADLSNSGTKHIVVRAAGTEMVDKTAAARCGIKISNIPSYSPESIGEYAFTLILALRRRLNIQRKYHLHNMNVRNIHTMGNTLKGKGLSLYGLGRIGKVIADIGLGFGMKVSFYDKYVTEFDPRLNRLDSLEDLLKKSDVTCVSVPLTDETRYSLNRQVLRGAKSGLTLINISRGDVLDPEAALWALDNGIIGGLGVDVWDSGAIDDRFDPRLLRDNVIQSHHIAFLTEEAVAEIIEQSIALCS